MLVIFTYLQIKVHNHFFFLNQTYVVGTQKNHLKEPSQRDGSFEHPIQLFKLLAKKIITILR